MSGGQIHTFDTGLTRMLVLWCYTVHLCSCINHTNPHQTPPGHTMCIIVMYKTNWFILSLLVSSCLDFQQFRTAYLTRVYFSLLYYFWALRNTVMHWLLRLILVSQSWIFLRGVPSSGVKIYFMRDCSRSLTSTCAALVGITGTRNNILWSSVTGLQFKVVNRVPSIVCPINSVWNNLICFTTHSLMYVLQPMQNILAYIGNLPMFKVKNSLWPFNCVIATAE